jgi:hypothetical protein
MRQTSKFYTAALKLPLGVAKQLTLSDPEQKVLFGVAQSIFNQP